MWIGVWCYFPGWANCLWGSVLSLWLQSDFAPLRDAAVGPWYGSNEELWQAGCLLAAQGGFEGGCRGTEDGSKAKKGEEWSMRGRWEMERREAACSVAERGMKGKKAREARGRETITLGQPGRPDACHCSTLLLWQYCLATCTVHSLTTHCDAPCPLEKTSYF